MYMIHNDVGAYLIWFTASTTTLHCGLPLGGNKICSNLGRTSTNAHSKNIKVVKSFMNVSQWCGSPFKWVYNLN